MYWDLVIAKLLPGPSSESLGVQSLEERMMRAGFTVDEFSKLKEAQNRSDDLQPNLGSILYLKQMLLATEW